MAITGHITPHFTWPEATANSGYEKIPTTISFHGVMLTGTEAKANAIKHAGHMESLRSRLNYMRGKHGLGETGIVVLSWVRSPQHNHDVGGAPLSRHQYWDACDIALSEIDRLCPWPSGRADFDAACEYVFALGGVGLYPAGNRHVDSRGYRARWTSF